MTIVIARSPIVAAALYPCGGLIIQHEFGIPNLLFGPVGGGAHNVDEYVDFAAIMTTAEMLLNAALEWCSGEHVYSDASSTTRDSEVSPYDKGHPIRCKRSSRLPSQCQLSNVNRHLRKDRRNTGEFIVCGIGSRATANAKRLGNKTASASCDDKTLIICD
jgi:hypothetical protein